jgi:hypothetical protein
MQPTKEYDTQVFLLTPPFIVCLDCSRYYIDLLAVESRKNGTYMRNEDFVIMLCVHLALLCVVDGFRCLMSSMMGK